MKISNSKIYEQVADLLLEQIKSDAFEIGDKLPSIQKLATTYGVSVASIREALNALRTIGVIEIKQGYGTVVKQKEPTFFEIGEKFNSLDQIKELLELRQIIESATVAKAAKMRNEEDLRMMHKYLNEMSRAVSDGTSGEEADLEFHLTIAKAAHNSLLVDLMKDSMKETRKIFIYSRQKTMEKLQDEHEQIYNAIERKDNVEATECMNTHLTTVINTTLANFNENKSKF